MTPDTSTVTRQTSSKLSRPYPSSIVSMSSKRVIVQRRELRDDVIPSEEPSSSSFESPDSSDSSLPSSTPRSAFISVVPSSSSRLPLAVPVHKLIFTDFRGIMRQARFSFLLEKKGDKVVATWPVSFALSLDRHG